MFGFLCGPNFSTYLAKYLGLQLLDCIVRSCLALQENTKPSSNLVVKVSVAQSCLTLCESMDCGPLGSPVHGILLARMLECVVIPFSRGSSHPGVKPGSAWLQADSLLTEPQKSLKVAVPFSVSTSNEWELLLLHTLSIICFFQCFKFQPFF